ARAWRARGARAVAVGRSSAARTRFAPLSPAALRERAHQGVLERCHSEPRSSVRRRSGRDRGRSPLIASLMLDQTLSGGEPQDQVTLRTLRGVAPLPLPPKRPESRGSGRSAFQGGGGGGGTLVGLGEAAEEIAGTSLPALASGTL